MRKYTKQAVFLLFLLTSSVMLPQKRTLYDYFPHNVGDAWYYMTNEMSIHPSYYTLYISKVEIVESDTAKYIYYNNYSLPLYKIKLTDSSTVYFGSKTKWQPYIKFSNNPGEYWLQYENSHIYQCFIKEFSINFYNANTKVFEFWLTGYEPKILGGYRDRYLYLKGIGYYSREYDIGRESLIGCLINGVSYGVPVSIDTENRKIPDSFTLTNYPNPFNSTTKIVYHVPVSSNISIKILDILGREVAVIEEGNKAPGTYTKFWNPTCITSGTYLLVYRFNGNRTIKKISFIK